MINIKPHRNQIRSQGLLAILREVCLKKLLTGAFLAALPVRRPRWILSYLLPIRLHNCYSQPSAGQGPLPNGEPPESHRRAKPCIPEVASAIREGRTFASSDKVGSALFVLLLRQLSCFDRRRPPTTGRTCSLAIH